MIVEGIARLVSNILITLFSAFEVVSLPLSLINTLYSIIAYGTYIVGADVMLVFASTVVLWWGIHLSIGLALWVYEKIPFV